MTPWRALGNRVIKKGLENADLLHESYLIIRKLTLHEIKVLKIDATQINTNLMENDFWIRKINAKEEVEFHNNGN